MGKEEWGDSATVHPWLGAVHPSFRDR